MSFIYNDIIQEYCDTYNNLWDDQPFIPGPMTMPTSHSKDTLRHRLSVLSQWAFKEWLLWAGNQPLYGDIARDELLLIVSEYCPVGHADGWHIGSLVGNLMTMVDLGEENMVNKLTGTMLEILEWATSEEALPDANPTLYRLEAIRN